MSPYAIVFFFSDCCIYILFALCALGGEENVAAIYFICDGFSAVPTKSRIKYKHQSLVYSDLLLRPAAKCHAPELTI